MKHFSTFFLLFGILSFIALPINTIAQSNSLSAKLNEKENKKINSAQKLISKGNTILSESEEDEKEIKKLKDTDGRIKTGKINKLNKKIAANKMKAAVYFEDGYNKHIKTLDGRLKDFEKNGVNDAEKIRSEVKILQKKAKKQYNKAERLSSPDEMVELVELAQENQKKAIEVQKAGLQKLLTGASAITLLEEDEKITEEIPETEIVPQDSITHTNTETNPMDTNETPGAELNTAAVAPSATNPNMGLVTTGVGAAAVAATVTNTEEEQTATEASDEATMNTITEEKIIEEETSVEENITAPISDSPVFLSIQFLADKQKASNEKLAQAYQGELEIIEMEGDGWFRYSVGKFTDVETARSKMKSEGIKGFIVAYNENKRISVREAMDLLKK